MAAPSIMSNSMDDFLAPLPAPSIASLSLPSHSPAKPSHYRPISTILSSAPALDASPSKSRRNHRPLSSAFPTMGFLMPHKHKGKEKEERPVTPQRDSFFNRTLKSKKSFNSLVTLTEDGPPLSSTPPAIYTPTLDSSFAESSTSGYSTPTFGSASVSSSSSSSTFVPATPSSPDYSDRYEAKENWITRKHRLKLHPYGDEAPYMQSYDIVALSNDRYMHTLLRRLNVNRSPSFYDYVQHNKPLPTSVLDLGCGEGYWLLDAANSWPDAQIVGFDLVDVTVPEVHKVEHLKFVRGNFVRYPLPFPPNSFDLVRISNLSLAIPTERWEYVLSEVFRVLQVGGRVELIDDSVYFPWMQSSSSNPRTKSFTDSPKRRNVSPYDDDQDLVPPDEATNEHQDGEIDREPEREREQSIQVGKAVLRGSFWADSDTEAVEMDGTTEEPSPEVAEDGTSDCPSSPETSGELDSLFLDLEDSSSASSLQDLEDDEDLSSCFPLPPATIPLVRPPPPRRPLPPIPLSPGPMTTSFTPTTRATDEGDDDLVTPTKLDITLPLPTPTFVLNSDSNSPHFSSEDEPTSPLCPEVTPDSPLDMDDSEWSSHATDGKALEDIFYNMLETKYGIYTRTPKAISSVIKGAFGSQNVRKLPTMHLKLAPTQLEELIPREKRPKFRGRASSKATERLDDDDEFGVAKKPWMHIERDGRREKKLQKEHSVPFPTMKEVSTRSRTSTMESIEGRSSSESVVVPNALSAKAAVRLGITYSALAAATKSAQAVPTASSSASIHSDHSSGSAASASCLSDEIRRDSSETEETLLELADDPVQPIQQSPGLLLMPSTFIPMPPSELEMHACKHMHTLLSCKRAMSDWILYNEDGSESDGISEESLRDAFFEYDSFRRQRFHWPSYVPETNVNDLDYSKNIEVPFEGPKSPYSHKSTHSVDSRISSTSETSIGPFNRHELTHVRTIRVYLATKTRKLLVKG